MTSQPDGTGGSIRRKTPTASKSGKEKTNGVGKRRLTSWIDEFVRFTAELESPEIFRRWGAISCLAAVMERKVFVAPSGSVMYPNLFVFLIGPPGVGKTRVIEHTVKRFIELLPDPKVVPKNVSMQSMIDFLNEYGKRNVPRIGQGPLEYHTGYMLADELSVFMSEWDYGIVAGLTSLWDGIEYSEWKRGNTLRIKMKELSFNILAGATPGHLDSSIPAKAWDQGFMSRVLMIYADQRKITDIFKPATVSELPKDMVHDLHVMNDWCYELGWDEDFSRIFTEWRMAELAKDPTAMGPKHPMLVHYNVRRTAQMLKLSMVACIDRGQLPMLTLADFQRAHSWLREAEIQMPLVFEAGMGGDDAKALDQIMEFVKNEYAKTKKPIYGHRIIQEASKRLDLHKVLASIEILKESKRLVLKGTDKTGTVLKFLPGEE